MDEGAGVRCGLSESAAESLLDHAAKAIEIEDIQALVAEFGASGGSATEALSHGQADSQKRSQRLTLMDA